ncbi:hypothetical protein [Calorimonas adulescens]|nr:hypothetical protein [Calorimonas adulescens]
MTDVLNNIKRRFRIDRVVIVEDRELNSNILGKPTIYGFFAYWPLKRIGLKHTK